MLVIGTEAATLMACVPVRPPSPTKILLLSMTLLSSASDPPKTIALIDAAVVDAVAAVIVLRRICTRLHFSPYSAVRFDVNAQSEISMSLPTHMIGVSLTTVDRVHR